MLKNKSFFVLLLSIVLLFAATPMSLAAENEPMNVEREISSGDILSINGVPYYNCAEDAPIVNSSEVEYSINGVADNGKMSFKSTAIITPYGIYPSDTWCKSRENASHEPESFYLTSYDKDEIYIHSPGAQNFILKTSSFTTSQVTGSLKFGFEDYVEASMSVSVGTQWGKEFTFTVSNPVARTKYLLESNCEVKQTDYIYFESKLFGGYNTHTSATHDKNGNVYNFSTSKF